MAPNRHRRHRRSFLVSLAVVVALAACDSDALDPDVTIDNYDLPPATNTRTIDPPTVSNLPITQP